MANALKESRRPWRKGAARANAKRTFHSKMFLPCVWHFGQFPSRHRTHCYSAKTFNIIFLCHNLSECSNFFWPIVSSIRLWSMQNDGGIIDDPDGSSDDEPSDSDSDGSAASSSSVPVQKKASWYLHGCSLVNSQFTFLWFFVLKDFGAFGYSVAWQYS